MISLRRTVNWTFNVLSLFLIVLVAWFCGQRLLSSGSDSASLPQHLRRGAQVRLANINWAANKRTLVMGLSVGCHFCEESAKFYKSLLRSAPPGSFYTIAVLPQTPTEGHGYLLSLGLNVSDVRQVDFGTLGILGTPTLILADETGHIRTSWVGKLSTSQENDVFRTLGISRIEDAPVEPIAKVSEELPPGVISAAQLRDMLKASPSLPIIDVRERPEYRKGHLSNAANIPLDELETRAPHEVSLATTVVAYCHYCAPCETKRREEGVLTFCTMTGVVLKGLGYSDVRLVGADLVELQRAGIRVTGDLAESSASRTASSQSK